MTKHRFLQDKKELEQEINLIFIHFISIPSQQDSDQKSEILCDLIWSIAGYIDNFPEDQSDKRKPCTFEASCHITNTENDFHLSSHGIRITRSGLRAVKINRVWDLEPLSSAEWGRWQSSWQHNLYWMSINLNLSQVLIWSNKIGPQQPTLLI